MTFVVTSIRDCLSNFLLGPGSGCRQINQMPSRFLNTYAMPCKYQACLDCIKPSRFRNQNLETQLPNSSPHCFYLCLLSLLSSFLPLRKPSPRCQARPSQGDLATFRNVAPTSTAALSLRISLIQDACPFTTIVKLLSATLPSGPSRTAFLARVITSAA